VNNRRIGGVDHRVQMTDALSGKYLVLRKGKKNFFLVKLVR
jgi:tyrosyl-tRNA synthetase